MRGRMPDANAVRRGVTDAIVPEIVDDAQPPAEQPKVAKPPEIMADPVLSEIWDWVCPPVNHYSAADIPLIKELVLWHATFTQAAAEMRAQDGGVNVLADAGELVTADGRTVKLLRKHPAIDVMKSASAEIRALSNELALSPMARSRLGLNESSTLKNLSALDTAKMFRAPDAKYKLPGS